MPLQRLANGAILKTENGAPANECCCSPGPTPTSCEINVSTGLSFSSVTGGSGTITFNLLGNFQNTKADEITIVTSTIAGYIGTYDVISKTFTSITVAGTFTGDATGTLNIKQFPPEMLIKVTGTIPTWQADTVYAEQKGAFATITGQYVLSSDGDLYEVTNFPSGDRKSGLTEPTWNTTLGATTTDNDITWTRRDQEINFCGKYWYLNATPPLWAASTSTFVGQRVTSTAGNYYECTAVSGSSPNFTGATEPTWNTTLGATTTDNEVTWTRVDDASDSTREQTVCPVRYGLLTGETFTSQTGGFPPTYTAKLYEAFEYWNISTSRGINMARGYFVKTNGFANTFYRYGSRNDLTVRQWKDVVYISGAGDPTRPVAPTGYFGNFYSLGILCTSTNNHVAGLAAYNFGTKIDYRLKPFYFSSYVVNTITYAWRQGNGDW